MQVCTLSLGAEEGFLSRVWVTELTSTPFQMELFTQDLLGGRTDVSARGTATWATLDSARYNVLFPESQSCTLLSWVFLSRDPILGIIFHDQPN